MARVFKDNNYQIVNFTVERFGDIPQVIADWGIQIDHTLAGRTDHDFLQIAIRSVKQAVPLSRRFTLRRSKQCKKSHSCQGCSPWR